MLAAAQAAKKGSSESAPGRLGLAAAQAAKKAKPLPWERLGLLAAAQTAHGISIELACGLIFV